MMRKFAWQPSQSQHTGATLDFDNMMVRINTDDNIWAVDGGQYDSHGTYTGDPCLYLFKECDVRPLGLKDGERVLDRSLNPAA